MVLELKTIQVPNANAMKVACIGNSITYGARLILCLPATSYREEKHVDAEIAGKTFPLIQKIAKKNKLDVIDLHTPTSNHPELFPDKLHPNAEGERIIAEKSSSI